jgi:hypothetical protein
LRRYRLFLLRRIVEKRIERSMWTKMVIPERIERSMWKA